MEKCVSAFYVFRLFLKNVSGLPSLVVNSIKGFLGRNLENQYFLFD